MTDHASETEMRKLADTKSSPTWHSHNEQGLRQAGDLTNADFDPDEADETAPFFQGDTDTDTASNSTVYRLYPLRWFALAALCLLAVSNGMQELMYAIVEDTSALYFNASTQAINGLALIYLIVYVPVGFAAPWFLINHDLRVNLLVSAGANAFGSAIKMAGALFPPQGNLAINYIGQLINAVVQVTIVSIPTLFVAEWFGENERVRANMISSMSGTIGVMLMSLGGPSVVSNDNPNTVATWIQIMSAPSIAAFVFLLFIPARPPTPPTVSACHISDSFFAGMKEIVRNKAYMILNITFGVGVGATSSFFSLLSQILSGFGYTDSDAGMVMAVMYGVGLISSFVVGIVVDKTKRFTEALKILYSASFVSCILLVLVLKPGQFILITLACALIGISGFGLIPLALELCVECTYPVSPATSAGLLWVSVQVFSAITFYIMGSMQGADNFPTHTVDAAGNDVLIPHPDMTSAGYFMLACLSSVVLAVSFFKTPYRRVEAERLSHAAKHTEDVDGDGTQSKKQADSFALSVFAS